MSTTQQDQTPGGLAAVPDVATAGRRRVAPALAAGTAWLMAGLVFGLAPPAMATDDAPRVEPPPSVKRRRPPPPRRGGEGDAAKGRKRDGAKGRKRDGAKPGKSRRDRVGGRGSKGTSLGRVSHFPPGTPLGLVRDAFRCALSHEFDCYAALNVSHNTDSPHARRHLRKYSWSAFEGRAPGYVVEEKPFTLHAVRYDPPRVDEETKRVKVYLLSREREYPAPITLVRSGTYWRIYTNSL